MKIKIITYTGNTREIHVEPTTTIEQVKEQLFALEGIKPEQQRILTGGVIIKDTDTIESINIKEGQALNMILHLKGGY